VNIFKEGPSLVRPATPLPTPPKSLLVPPALGDKPAALALTLQTTPDLQVVPSPTLSASSSATPPLLHLQPSFLPPPPTLPLPPSLGPLPPLSFPVPTARFALPASLSSLSAPSTSSLSSLSAPSTSSSSSSLIPASNYLNFNHIPPVLPAPLVPPTAALPRTVLDVATPLVKALRTLKKTCPLCWLHGLDNQHNLFVCPNIKPKKIATSYDPMFQIFKALVDCPANLSYCYGCLFPATVSPHASSNPSFTNMVYSSCLTWGTDSVSGSTEIKSAARLVRSLTRSSPFYITFTASAGFGGCSMSMASSGTISPQSLRSTSLAGS
jgi:hypothetical protein